AVGLLTSRSSAEPTAKSDFWSFKPAPKPAIPHVQHRTWARNPIDSFILAKLEEKGMKPSVEADRRTLIRRLSFDLTGLPPQPDKVESFVNDQRNDAYEK